MRWVVIGSQGMFGTELSKLLIANGQQVAGYNRSNINLADSVTDLVEQIGAADIVVNAVSYTAVDNAEHEPAEANLVNAEYAAKLAEAAKKLSARFFQISTDYVFDGLSTVPYGVTAEPNPQTEYGRSKLLAEQLVTKSGADYTIFRTSWLYGAHGKCFPKTIAKKLALQQEIKVVNDQIGAPTWARDFAEIVLAHGLHNYNEKIVHAGSSGSASWFEFAKAIATSIGQSKTNLVVAISSEQLNAAATRPKFSALDNSQTAGPIIGDWRERWFAAAEEVLAEFKIN